MSLAGNLESAADFLERKLQTAQESWDFEVLKGPGAGAAASPSTAAAASSWPCSRSTSHTLAMD